MRKLARGGGTSLGIESNLRGVLYTKGESTEERLPLRLNTSPVEGIVRPMPLQSKKLWQIELP